MEKRTALKTFSPSPEEADLSDDLLRLAEIIDTIIPGRGKELVVRFCDNFSGTYVYFPQIGPLFREARNAWIIKQFDNGGRARDIARAAGVSERQVWYILGR